MVHRLDSHRSKKDGRKISGVRRLLLESPSAVEYACCRDDHGHVIGCKEYMSACPLITFLEIGIILTDTSEHGTSKAYGRVPSKGLPAPDRNTRSWHRQVSLGEDSGDLARRVQLEGHFVSIIARLCRSELLHGTICDAGDRVDEFACVSCDHEVFFAEAVFESDVRLSLRSQESHFDFAVVLPKADGNGSSGYGIEKAIMGYRGTIVRYYLYSCLFA